MLNENSDRVLDALRYWNDREKSLKEVLGPDVVTQRHFLKEKFAYYNHVKKEFKKDNLSLGERLTRRIVVGEAKDIEKKLYPKRLERLFYRGLRQMHERIQAQRIPERMRALIGRVLFNRQSSPDTIKNHKQTQTQHSTSGKQSQKPVTDAERAIRPERHTIIDRTLRNDDRINGDRLNNLSNSARPERRLRHRLH